MHVFEVVICVVVVVSLCAFVSADLPPYTGNGETTQHWNQVAKDELRKARNVNKNLAVAKNVIIFLGDGMGVSTVTAARILQGQLHNKTGEETVLSFETFPHVGMSKTYNQDAQTPDSAATAVAFFSGVKTNWGTLGVDARARRSRCDTKNGTEISGILKWSLAAGKSVGFVTTTRVTHATPGALYAHTPERNWEGDVDMGAVTGGCVDISKQLIDENIDINVIMGGGRRTFMRHSDQDPEVGTNTLKGRRDGRNLLEEWTQRQSDKGRRHRYVWNQTDFDSVNPDDTDYMLGLFNSDHMNFESERNGDVAGEPSLAEMTEKAIRILRKNPKGYFLLVEGGRIDHAHHWGQGAKALYDTIAFADAVEMGKSLTDEVDTLVITTADHSHTFAIGGYPTRGNPIFGFTDDRAGHDAVANDGKPYTTLVYGNGPGAYAANTPKLRPDLRHTDTAHKDYRQQAGVPLTDETHAAEDVAIYARGPMSHLFHGIHEQHYIAHVMAYASCVGAYSDPESCAKADIVVDSVTQTPPPSVTQTPPPSVTQTPPPCVNSGTRLGTTFSAVVIWILAILGFICMHI